MKRWLVWLLAALLVLSGCNKEPSGETTVPPQQTGNQNETVPAESLLISGSQIEKNTNGSVLVYSPGQTVVGVGAMGEDIVVFSLDDTLENTLVTRIRSTDGAVMASTMLRGWVDPSAGSIGMQKDRFVYYDGEANCVLTLNEKFQQVDRVLLADTPVDPPVLSDDLTTAYYAVDSEIRALDLQTGIPRLVCQLNAQNIWLTGLLFEDTVISAYVTDSDWNSYEQFFSAQTGESLGKDPDLIRVESWGEKYLARRMDGAAVEVLLGTREDDELRRFDTAFEYPDISVLTGMECLVEMGYSETGAVIAVYEPEQGCRLAELTLEEVYCIYAPMEDPSGRYIWFITTDPETDKDVLCRWDFSGGEGADTQVRVGRRYTAEEPDSDGLAACREKADALEELYGIRILLGTEVIAPFDYTFTHEYQVRPIEKTLEGLEIALSRFPEGFFKKTASVSNNRTIHISIIRSMTALTENAPSVSDGLQYWIDGSAYMALTVTGDSETNFYHELSHVLDTYVYSNSIHYDFWEDNNPEGFAYDESYTQYESHYGSPWLEGEERAFIDAYSMTYAKEDRARFLEYAMMEDAADYFSSETMQAKLKQLCLGIREAFGWKKYEGSFIWEQYLRESLAYVKK